MLFQTCWPSTLAYFSLRIKSYVLFFLQTKVGRTQIQAITCLHFTEACTCSACTQLQRKCCYATIHWFQLEGKWQNSITVGFTQITAIPWHQHPAIGLNPPYHLEEGATLVIKNGSFLTLIHLFVSTKYTTPLNTTALHINNCNGQLSLWERILNAQLRPFKYSDVKHDSSVDSEWLIMQTFFLI